MGDHVAAPPSSRRQSRQARPRRGLWRGVAKLDRIQASLQLRRRGNLRRPKCCNFNKLLRPPNEENYPSCHSLLLIDGERGDERHGGGTAEARVLFSGSVKGVSWREDPYRPGR